MAYRPLSPRLQRQYSARLVQRLRHNGGAFQKHQLIAHNGTGGKGKIGGQEQLGQITQPPKIMQKLWILQSENIFMQRRLLEKYS